MDVAWWKVYIHEVRQIFQGRLFTVNAMGRDYERVQRVPKPFVAHGNSGCGAIALAAKSGAKKIILLGYDGQHTGGKTHWHGSHPRPLGDAASVGRWANQFSKCRAAWPTVEIINCSRQTAIVAFDRKPLEEVLCPTLSV